MKADKILLATDFSEYANAAMAFATSLARDSGAKLLIVHAVAPPPHSADRGFGGFQAEAEMESDAEALLAKVTPPDESVPFSHHVLHGAPDAEIVKFAAEENVDMIVMGTHGHSGLLRVLLGSVAEHVVRKAHCPVLIIKQPGGDG